MSKPAARMGDMHVCPKVEPGPIPHGGGPLVQGSPYVLIGGMPAARVGDMATCIGPPDEACSGSSTVLINDRPAVRMGDSCGHGGKIVTGCTTVLIGSGGGSGSDSTVALATSDSHLPSPPQSRQHKKCRNAVKPIKHFRVHLTAPLIKRTLWKRV